MEYDYDNLKYYFEVLNMKIAVNQPNYLPCGYFDLIDTVDKLFF